MLRSFSIFRLLLVLSAVQSLAVFAALGQVLNPQEQAISDHLHTSAQGRPFLHLDPILTQVARSRAADMANRGYFDHVNPDGVAANYLVRAAGYKLPDWWGYDPTANYIEAIAAGRPSADDTWNDWMNSPPHRQQLLATDDFDKASTSYGVGFATGGPYGYYWVVITAPPPPTPALTVTAPANGLRTFVPQATVSGVTGGTVTAQSVVFRVENGTGVGTFVTASGTTAWSGTATGLVPGPNTIRIRSLGANGTVLGETTRAVTYVVLKPLDVAITGDGTVTTGFIGTTQRELGVRYSIGARPNAGSLFLNWTGSVTSSAPVVSFIMAEGMSLTANFIPNPFLSKIGGYSGLISGDRAGLLTLGLTSTGAFSGRVVYDGHAYVLTGKFAPDGSATVTIKRGTGIPPLTVKLQLDVNGTTGVSGTISDGTNNSTFTADDNYKRAVGTSFAGAGRYTIVIATDPNTAGPEVPQGNGSATLYVYPQGLAVFSGNLADGTPFSTSGYFSADNVLSVYIPLYRGKGAITGTLTLRTTDVSNADGTLHWTKLASPLDHLYPAGFETTGYAIGSLWVRPKPGSQVLTVPATQNNSEITVGDGDLQTEVNQPTTLNSTNHLTVKNSTLPGLRVGIDVVSGRYSASFIHPVTKALTVVRGVILQKQNAGYGYFLGKDQSGYNSLTPMPN